MQYLFMKRLKAITFGMLALLAAGSMARAVEGGGDYTVKTSKVGGDGGFDYVYADSMGRKLYVARGGKTARMSIYDLDSLKLVTELPDVNARGAAVDAASHHGFASSSPVAMWDTTTLKVIKTIPVEGRPDGILSDAFNHRVYIFSHSAPNVTVIDGATGAVCGTIDLGGAPEQAASDGKGKIFIDLEDKDSVAVVDAKTMKVLTTYSLNGKGGGNAGLALDAKNHVLYVACREPAVMVMLDAQTGKYLADVPIGKGCDGAVFDPVRKACYSSQGDGTLTVIQQTGPTAFKVAETVATPPRAKTCTLDAKTGRILLIAAEYGAPPAGQSANGRPARGAMVPGSFSIVEVMPVKK
jgi:YVTN family beta-propeller protein